MATKAQKLAAEDSKILLRSYLKPGATVYTIVTHVSKSGMSRRIRCFRIDDGEPYDISGHVALILGYRRNDRDGGVIVGGCGMDMGFHLVNNLSYALHGYDDVGEAKEFSGRPFTPRPDAYRSGYSLNHRWL